MAGRKKAHLATVDLETGEVIPGTLVQVRNRDVVGAHMSVLQDTRRALYTDREITLNPLRVLLYLESVLGYENYLRITQQDIVAALGIHRSEVSRAMKLLLAKGIIERLESPVIRPVYRLNPNYGWRGKHEKWKTEKAKARPLKLVTAA